MAFEEVTSANYADPKTCASHAVTEVSIQNAYYSTEYVYRVSIALNDGVEGV